MIQTKGEVVDVGKDVVDGVVDELTERQIVIYKSIKMSVVENVIVSANSLANQMNMSPRTIQRDLNKLKEMNIIKHTGPDNGGHWIVLKDSKL